MAPSIVNSNQWQEITEDFLNSASQLNLGELLKSDHFTLLEAMSAIELMDPKMDSGMILNKARGKIFNFDQSLKLGRIKVDNLELSELIDIIDHTYACLVLWLDGHNLAQTVMTNLYLHSPEKIQDRCLRVFSQATLKIVDYLDSLVHLIFCIEEEDFMLNLKKFSLNTHTTDQKILSSIEDLCVYYEKLLTPQSKIKQPKQQQANSLTTPQQPQQSSPTIEPNDRIKITALIHRLRFTNDFYACFRNIAKNLFDLGQQQQQQQHIEQAQQTTKTIKLIQSVAASCDKNLERCLSHLDKWRETIDIDERRVAKDNNKGGSGSINNSSDNVQQVNNRLDNNEQTVMGFEPLINSKLLPVCYPRCLKIKTNRTSTVESLRDLTIKLRQCIEATHSLSNQKSYSDILSTIENLSKYSKPKSCVISRSFIQLLYEPIRSAKTIRNYIIQSMSEFCEPLMQEMKRDEARIATLNDFLNDCAPTLSQALFTYGHNPMRQHERYPELICNLKTLQYCGFLINSTYNNCLVYSWTSRFLANFCTKYILAGFELELFSTYEYPYIFWYLYEILYRNEKEQFEIVRNELYKSEIHDCNDPVCSQNSTNNHHHHNTNTNNHHGSGSKSSSSSSKKQQKRKASKLYDKKLHDRNIITLDAYRFLTGGLFVLTYGLKLQGKIKTPPADYTNEEICFNHRFSAIGGESVYQSYKDASSKLQKLEFIYREAWECFNEAKELFTQIGDHESCLKVCKTNLIVAKILSTNLNSFEDREIEFSFDTHPSFPTLKV